MDRSAPLSAVVGPVAPLATCAVVAALLGERWAERAAPVGQAAVWLTGLGALVAVLAAVVVRRRPHRAGIAMLLAVLAVTGVTAGGSAVRVDAAQAGLVPRLAASGGTAALSATVATEPRPIAGGWQVIVRVRTVDGVPTRERAALVLGDDPPALGERWHLTASARPLPAGGYGRWLARQHAGAVLDVRSIAVDGAPGLAARASEGVRDRVRRAATRHTRGPTGGLLVGFVTGDRRLLPASDQEAMRATGLTHLTAVSGSNVAIVLGGVLGLATLLGWSVQRRWVAVAAMLPWFAFVTRFEPSVSRASTMAGLLLLVSVLGRARDARHALAVAVLLLVLVDPRLAGSLGLLLSARAPAGGGGVAPLVPRPPAAPPHPRGGAGGRGGRADPRGAGARGRRRAAAATAGVLVLAPMVQRRLPDRLPRRVAELTAITIGAQIAVVPLLLVTFGEVGLASVPANIVAVPFAVVAATLGFLGTAAAIVSVPVGAWFFAAAAPAAEVVLWAAHGLAGVGGQVHLDHPASVIAVLAASVWTLARRRGPVARITAGLAAIAVVVSLVPSMGSSLPAQGLTLTAIDVGQGDAFLLESPRARILVDAGEDGTAARWLQRHGRRHLDLIVVTHPHLDHVGGVPDVLRSVEVGEVWAAPLPTSLPQAAEVFTEAAAQDVTVTAPIAGDVAVVGDLLIEVLHPPPGRPYRFARSELNESSYVLRVHHDAGRVLFPGDIEREAQADLLAAPDRLTTDVLAVPHHGSATTDPAFLAAVGPRIGVISAGTDNRHGHPHPDILTALDGLGVDVRRTDLEGTVRIVVDGPGPSPPASVELREPTGVAEPAG
ncbi:MAG: ComEC/Rec2 family competence protein [Nitriliruptoraceae bacterium]|nr:ComEC/Rec2 family competence protein [Nitriliruptoraceae bacterium]